MKLHMLVSDGQSADIGYHRTAAEEGLRGIQREHQHKGILFVAAAIGSGKENIERIDVYKRQIQKPGKAFENPAG